ncbi:MAG: phosphoribosyl-AMP cyclohydrolase [Deltaproteobacteria bacterium]|nr:MAG: phosphoribosyl-AMP cyclohydrolase [Deltaproteobacteria bacterium]
MNEINFDQQGLVPVIVQDHIGGQVLMLAYMNREALKETIATGRTHFYSRSRKRLWKKGESSGHTQEVKEIYFDCDQDTLLIKVDQNMAACHEGYRSCFYRKLEGDSLKICQEKVFDEKKVYEKK